VASTRPAQACPEPSAKLEANQSNTELTASKSITSPVLPGDIPASQSLDSTTATEHAIDQWRLISHLKKRYALYETPRGLVMVHLRHADQRIRFERICQDFKQQQQQVPSQRLLVPQPIDLDPLAAQALKGQLNLLNTQGFEIEEFGRNFYRICAVPSWLNESQAEIFIRDLLDLVRQRGDLRKPSELAWQAIAKLAVQGSYQSSDAISEISMQQLARDLFSCEKPHTSPFGKPTFSEISWNEWERRFGAT